jgi:hypothetical protein
MARGPTLPDDLQHGAHRVAGGDSVVHHYDGAVCERHRAPPFRSKASRSHTSRSCVSTSSQT